MATQNLDQGVVQEVLKSSLVSVDMGDNGRIFWLSILTFLNKLIERGKILDQSIKFTKCEKVQTKIFCYSSIVQGQSPVEGVQLKVIFSQLEIEKLFASGSIMIANYKQTNDDVLIGFSQPQTTAQPTGGEPAW